MMEKPFKRRDLLGIRELDADEITGILDTAENFREIDTREIKKVPALRGKTVINLFFENSTRTRTSFELAAKRLSADAVNISVSSSSVSKGETLLDTALNLDAMQPDCIVVRHSSAGVPHQLARVSKAAIINAGDGANEHPTQALLDAMTIREHKKKIEGLNVAIVGDIIHSRVARSNIHLLTKLGARVKVAGPGTLVPKDFEHLISQSHLREWVGSVTKHKNPPANAGGSDLAGPMKENPPADAGGTDLAAALKQLLAAPNICSKHWVYEQYDSMVRTNTAVLPGSDAAVIRVKETRRAIAMCLDGPGRYVAVNAKEGAKLAVAEAARNVACVGAKPIAVTNCLNFASPERPEVMRSFSDVIDGMAEACNVFETPVVSGNVSFYNETEGRGILPTPTIGMVGLIDDTRKIITQGFKNEGDVIAMLGTTKDDLSVSEYAQTVLGLSTEELIENGRVPQVDLALEKQVQDTLLKLADDMLVHSAHDCSDGGLAVALAESCFSSLGRDAVGATIDLQADGLSAQALLFGESPSRVVITFAPADLEKIRQAVGDCPFEVIGTVGNDMLKIAIDGEDAVSQSVMELEAIWETSLEKRLSA